MEAAMIDGRTRHLLNTGQFTGSTGTTILQGLVQTAEPDQLPLNWKIVTHHLTAVRRLSIDQLFPDPPPLNINQLCPNISTEPTPSQQIFAAIQALYLSANGQRDRQIADRITALHRDAIAEGDRILPESLNQLKDFFLKYPDLGIPKITLTPDCTLRVRWIHGHGILSQSNLPARRSPSWLPKYLAASA